MDNRLTVYNEEQAAKKLKLPVSAFIAMCKSGEVAAFKDAATGRYMITRDNLKYFSDLWMNDTEEEPNLDDDDPEDDPRDGYFGAMEVHSDEAVDFFANNQIAPTKIPDHNPAKEVHHPRGGKYTKEEQAKKDWQEKYRQMKEEEEEGEDSTVEIDEFGNVVDNSTTVVEKLRDNDFERVLTSREEYNPVENDSPATVDAELERIYDKVSENIMHLISPKLKQIGISDKEEAKKVINEISSNSPDPEQVYSIMEFLSKTSSKVVVTQIAFYK